MNRTRLLLPFLIILGPLASCSNESPVQQNGTATIVPLKSGNRWIARVTYLDSTGQVTATIFDTTQIIEEKVIANETWYRTNKQEMLTVRSSGLWSYNALVPVSKPVLVAMFPTSAGARFSIDTLVTDGDSITTNMVVTSTDLSVTVPKGTYKCYQYKQQWRRMNGDLIDKDGIAHYDSVYSSLYEDYNDDNYICYAPGTGYVKKEMFNRTADGRTYPWYRWELIEIVAK